MANPRELDKRRKSIKNIRKITRTMELIATARFRKAMDRASAATAYTNQIMKLVKDLVNAGVSGETSAGGLRRLDWVLREPLDVLVVELGANDGLRGLDPFQMSDNLVQIARRTRTRYPDARIVLAGMEAPPNLGPLYTEAFRAIFSSVADDANALLIPFLLDGVAGIPSLNQRDGIHPTPEGHRFMASNAFEVLGPLFAELSPEPAAR